MFVILSSNVSEKESRKEKTAYRTCVIPPVVMGGFNDHEIGHPCIFTPFKVSYTVFLDPLRLYS